jgi:hypothetical protein
VTERKPGGLGWESWTEKQIEEGRRAGLFDGLDGTGKPIDGLDGVHDEEWWIKAKLRRENIDYLPPTIAIRGERDAAVAAALDAADEGEARRILEQINERIRYVNSHTVSGPPSTVWVVDEESVLERWRAAHPVDEPEPDRSPGDLPAEDSVERPRRRLGRPFARRHRGG